MQRLRSRTTVGVGLVAVALAAGTLAFGGLGGDDPAGPAPRAPSRNATPIPAADGDNDAVMATTPIEPQRPAATAEAAVVAYLDAETDGRFDDSFALLSSEDRSDIGRPDVWREQHSVSPRVTFYSIVSEPGRPIVTEATFEPRVDETVGVIAGSARITWATVEEAGGFVIDRTGTKVESHYPDEATAGAGVSKWLRRIEADDPPVGYVGSLLGQPDLVDEIIAATGTFTPGKVIELDRWDTPEVITNAFGPDAAVWSRVVHVTGPVEFDAVVAPFGDEWVVVGVVAT